MSKHYAVKQVIVVRRDLRNTRGERIRGGKLAAQVAHASMMWLTNRLCSIWEHEEHVATLEDATMGDDSCGGWFSDSERAWVRGKFAKIVLGVDSLAELEELVARARLVGGFSVEVVTDSGATEFGGVPTVTCAAFGPTEATVIDEITGQLRPL